MKFKNIDFRNMNFKKLNFKNIKNYIIFTLVIIILYLIFYILKTQADHELLKKEEINNINKLERNFFWDNFKLKDYSLVDFKITEEWKKIIKDARELKNTPTLISRDLRDEELCAWYIWVLSEKIWGKMSPYYIWMMNKKSQTPAKAWELPAYYAFLWWKELVDFTWKFSLKEKDLYKNITKKELKWFFLEAFSEEALFWDIGFLYKNSWYIWFLEWWNSNSHIAKNLWITKFDFDIKDEEKSILDIIWCNKDNYDNLGFILENYKIWLNSKRIVFKNKEFFYLNDKNEILEKVEFKFWDKLSYEDITIVHFYDKIARVDSLFKFTCQWDFLPINVISINPRFIEKM